MWLLATMVAFCLSLFLNRKQGDLAFWKAFAGLLFTPFLFAGLVFKLLAWIWRS